LKNLNEQVVSDAFHRMMGSRVQKT